MKQEINKIYNLPEYYDIAFSYDINPEINIYRNIFEKHVSFEVKNILEPACGTGRFLTGFPGYGFNITGYDISEPEINYANAKITNLNLNGSAEAILDNMISAKFARKYDSAINSINSIGYILKDEEIVSHFMNTSDSVKKGGVYVIQLDCCPENLSGRDLFTEWYCERDGIRVDIRWGLSDIDLHNKLSHQYCHMKINDKGNILEINDYHVLRLWIFEDLKKLIEESGKLKLESVYNEYFQEINTNNKITGELGNLYYVLKVL